MPLLFRYSACGTRRAIRFLGSALLPLPSTILLGSWYRLPETGRLLLQLTPVRRENFNFQAWPLLYFEWPEARRVAAGTCQSKEFFFSSVRTVVPKSAPGIGIGTRVLE